MAVGIIKRNNKKCLAEYVELITQFNYLYVFRQASKLQKIRNNLLEKPQ